MKCIKPPKVAFHTLLSIRGPFSPTKSVFKVPYPLSFDNRGTKVAEYIHFPRNDFLVFTSLTSLVIFHSLGGQYLNKTCYVPSHSHGN